MLCVGKLFLNKILLFCVVHTLLITKEVEAVNATIATVEWSSDFTNNLLNLLKQCEASENLTGDTLFGALMAEFLIKEKVRYFEPTRYEEQLFAEILQRLSDLIENARNSVALQRNLTVEQQTIFENVFQRDVRLWPPKLKHGHINTNLKFGSLLKDYERLVHVGFPSARQSDFCMAMIVGSQTCDISNACLNVITSDSPTFGYQRTHQILLLYVFMHHKCAKVFGSQLTYELLASKSCTQVYREQNVIRSLNITAAYRDLYLEQNVVCGLLGYAEFLNWRSVDLMSSWPHAGACLCQSNVDSALHHRNNCECANHINSLALVYLTNAVLLLN